MYSHILKVFEYNNSEQNITQIILFNSIWIEMIYFLNLL